MTGPAVPPGGEELREVVALAMIPVAWKRRESVLGRPGTREQFMAWVVDTQSDRIALADAVLALPAVQAALAAQEKLRRAEALIGRWAGSSRGLSAAALLSDLRRALDGGG